MQIERVIGSYGQGKPGPLLFCMGGIHGNEPAGVLALHRVFSKLEGIKPPFVGKLIGIAGNVHALRSQQRYIHRDLNRLWSEEEITRVKALPIESRNSEEKELMELMRFIEASSETPYEPKIYVDMHTTSAPGGLFSIITHDPRNRKLAESLKAPIIFNLVNELALTTNGFFENRNMISLAFEAGQHDDPQSVDNHEAAIWILLSEIGCIKSEDVPDFQEFPNQLQTATQHLEQYLSVCYRHPVTSEDEFLMRPGYVNFQRVYEGENVAADKRGVIASPCTGQMLMPLYQNQGEDGFFVVEKLERPLV